VDTKAETESEKIAAQYLVLKTKYHAGTKILINRNKWQKQAISTNMIRHSNCISLPIVGKTTICEVT
jgi:capsular polysaccharide biosynthesis protein